MSRTRPIAAIPATLALALAVATLGGAAPGPEPSRKAGAEASPADARPAENPKADALNGDDRARLLRYARDTWHSFEAMAMPSGLPADGLRRQPDGSWEPTAHSSPTDIAAYLWSVLAAEELRIIRPDESQRRLDQTLGSLGRMERDHGFFYNKLNPGTGHRLDRWPEDGSHLRKFLSTVDNGWLAAALIMVRNARPASRARAEALLEPMDFAFFHEPFDPSDPIRHPGLLHGGYDIEKGGFTVFYGMANTEPRIASYIGIARGQLPRDHYYRMLRTRQPGQTREKQKVEGVTRSYLGIPVFEGHLTYRGMRIVPSWGGSMFEALMVPLLVPEAHWAPRSWGVNHPLYVKAQIEHGLDEARYGYWGFSSANKPEGGYRAYGVDAIGADPDGYCSNNDDTRYDPDHPPPPSAYTNGVVTPHASFLALPFAPRAAMDNLKAMEKHFPGLYGPNGFHDSVNVATGAVSDAVLALDQGMILAALANVLADGAMQRAFCAGEIERTIRPLIAPEEFTAGD